MTKFEASRLFRPTHDAPGDSRCRVRALARLRPFNIIVLFKAEGAALVRGIALGVIVVLPRGPLASLGRKCLYPAARRQSQEEQ